MRRMSFSIFPVVAISLAIMMTGCSTAPDRGVSDIYANSEAVNRAALPERETTTAPLESSQPQFAGPWEDPSSPLYERTIYFDYNTAEIKPEFAPLLREHARFLGTSRGTKVTLEGHTDERGTREYNLALADQRADAVRRFLLAEGVPANQMSTLSYGEERPADPGHSEQAWRLNRRVIIQY